ncbi:MAG: S41 family peptidase [Bacteroidota bacterium]
MPSRIPRPALLVSLVLAAVGASAQPVTIEIDLATVSDTLQLDAQSVGVRGDTAPLAWDRSAALTDEDGDGVYTATLDFPEGTGTVAYKVVLDRAGELTWERGDNRILMPGRMDRDRRVFGATQTDLPVRTVSTRQLGQDLALLQSAMQALHPGLRLHTSDAELAAIVEKLSLATRQLGGQYGEAIPVPAAYLPITKAVAAIRDGHTQVSVYNQSAYTEAMLYRRADRVPFSFRLVGERMIVTGDATPDRALPVGTEILALDGRSVREVIEALMPYASADGSNDAKRRDLLQIVDLVAPAERFDVVYSLLFAPEGDLELAIRQPDGTERALEVPRMTADARRDVLWARDASLPRSRGDLLQASFLDDGTAILRIGSFATFNMNVDYNTWLVEAFREMKSRGAERLIVDVRGNGGGMDDAASLLFAHIIQEPTEVTFWKGVTAYDRVLESLRPHVRSWSNDFYDLSDRVTRQPDGTFALAGRPPVTVSPAPDAFTGDVAVLIDAGPSSATFYLANTIEQTGAATLVGQTTGGSLKGLNAGQMIFLTLPNTGLVVDVPIFGSRPPELGPDRGVIPDVLVEPDADAVMEGRDPEMEAALAVLAGEAVDATPAPTPSQTDALLGTWMVDLRPTPESETYTQPFILRASDDAPFSGSFYNSPIQSAVVNDDWGDLRVAFTTSDGSGVYHHTAVLRDGRLHGTTHSIGRGFLAVWTAARPLPLADLAGDWAGTLTYTDYQDDASQVTLTTAATVEAVPGGAQLVISFIEPNGSPGGTTLLTLRDGAVAFEYDGLAWTELEREVGGDSFRLVIEREGTDNNRAATLRHTLSYIDGTLSDRKEVRYAGTDRFFQRNVSTFTR